MKTKTPRKPAAKRLLPDLERDTPIVAIAAARAVLESRAALLGRPLPDSLARQLARRAKLHYRNNPVFRRRLRAPGDRGRDTLYAFMHHWLDEWFADRVLASGQTPKSRLTVIHSTSP